MKEDDQVWEKGGQSWQVSILYILNLSSLNLSIFEFDISISEKIQVIGRTAVTKINDRIMGSDNSSIIKRKHFII